MLIQADLHAHTIASDHAYSTVLEMATYAGMAGLSALAITDHAPEMPDAPHHWHFGNLEPTLPRVLMGVTLIFGAEANVLDFDGSIDTMGKEYENLDWIVASMHNGVMKAGSTGDITDAYLNLAKNPVIDVIGHPAFKTFEFDYERVLPVFRDNEKLVEINEGQLSGHPEVWDNYREIARLCKKHSVPVVVNSDSHFCMNVGVTSTCERFLQEVDFPRELIVNTSWERVKAHITKKHGNIFG